MPAQLLPYHVAAGLPAASRPLLQHIDLDPPTPVLHVRRSSNPRWRTWVNRSPSKVGQIGGSCSLGRCPVPLVARGRAKHGVHHAGTAPSGAVALTRRTQDAEADRLFPSLPICGDSLSKNLTPAHTRLPLLPCSGGWGHDGQQAVPGGWVAGLCSADFSPMPLSVFIALIAPPPVFRLKWYSMET